MKRTDPCPDCGGSGRRATLFAKHSEHKEPDGKILPAYDGPAQCDRCAGTGKVGLGHVDRALRVPHDHPRILEIAELLKSPAKKEA